MHSLTLRWRFSCLVALGMGMAVSAFGQSGMYFSPDPVDSPDANGVDSNGDGIDGMKRGPVFVSAAHGNDGNPGTIERPVATLAMGITISRYFRSVVYIDTSGPQTLPITATQSFSVFGGYSAFSPGSTRWTRTGRTVVSPASTTVFYGDFAGGRIDFDRVELIGAPGQSQSPAMALVLRTTTAMRVFMTNSIVRAGVGSSGAHGAHGSDGVPGSRGINGEDGRVGSTGLGLFAPAGGAGLQVASGSLRNSGGGGRGGRFQSNPFPGESGGNDMEGSGGGQGGAAGTFVSAQPGRSGNDQPPGADGSHGTSGVNNVLVLATAGRDGLGGPGGGGGGAAAASFTSALSGGGGGSGGTGAKGGGPGLSGERGGNSIAIFSPSTVAVTYSLENTVLGATGGNGGNGGNGGRWAAGGAPGLGGAGAGSGIVSGRGGDGGSGGDGGAGGSGAGGASGRSIGILYSNGSEPFIAGGPTYDLRAGNVGLGGTSQRRLGPSKAPNGALGVVAALRGGPDPFTSFPSVAGVQGPPVLAAGLRMMTTLDKPVTQPFATMLSTPSHTDRVFSVIRGGETDRGWISSDGQSVTYTPKWNPSREPYEEFFSYDVDWYTAPGGAFVDSIAVQAQVIVLRPGRIVINREDWVGAEVGGRLLRSELEFQNAIELQLPSVTFAQGVSTAFPVPLDNPPIRLKYRHWLGQVVTPVVAPDGTAVYTFDLINGDVDGDNAITVFDYDRLSAAFDASSGDANWDDMADLDGDGTVTVFDYDILSANFDQVGD